MSRSKMQAIIIDPMSHPCRYLDQKEWLTKLYIISPHLQAHLYFLIGQCFYRQPWSQVSLSNLATWWEGQGEEPGRLADDFLRILDYFFVIVCSSRWFGDCIKIQMQPRTFLILKWDGFDINYRVIVLRYLPTIAIETSIISSIYFKHLKAQFEFSQI